MPQVATSGEAGMQQPSSPHGLISVQHLSLSCPGRQGGPLQARLCCSHKAAPASRRCSLAAGLKPDDTLLDLYCGVGAIGLCLASQCRQVLGWEVVPQAVADARLNAQLNGIGHAQFFCDDLQKPFALPSGYSVDVIVAGELSWSKNTVPMSCLGLHTWHCPASALYWKQSPAC